MKLFTKIKEQIKNFNLGKSRQLPEDAEVCAGCNKAQIVPVTSQENFITLTAEHHYGSPRDGNIEVYNICLLCFDKLIKGQPVSVKNIFEDI